jgi:hypothetical protein
MNIPKSLRALRALPSLALIVILAACSANSGAPATGTGTGTGGTGGTGTGGTSTETSGTPPAVNMKLSSVSINPGESATITWDSDAADTCTASGAWSGAQLLDNGNGITTGPLPAGVYSFGLTCVGPGGSSSKVVTLVVGTPDVPVVDLQVSPSTIQPGDSVVVEWDSTNATSCTGVGGTGSDGWAATQALDNLSGISVGPLSTAGQYAYQLNCTGPGGTTTASQIVTVADTAPPAPPTLTFTASPLSVAIGQSINLTWNAGNATGCVASGGTGSDSWTGNRATTGTGLAIGPISTAGTYTYSLTCSGTGGSLTKDVTVIVGSTTAPPIPTVQISVNPTSISSGTSANLTWSTTNATACTAQGSWGGSKPISGSAVTTGTLTTQGVYSYTLTCSGPGGDATATALLTVTAPAATVLNLSIVPNTIVAGQTTTINWTSVNATSCTASGGTGSDGWTGSQAASSSGTTIGPIATAGTYTYKLVCTGTGGASNPSSATLVVTPAPPPASVTSLSANPQTVTAGNNTTITWNTSGTTSCVASGGASGDGWASSSKALSNTSGQSVGPLNTAGTYTYTLNCTGPGGSSGNVSTTVTVNSGGTNPTPPAAIGTFSATPTTVNTGGSIVLIWTTTGASSCTASGGATGDGWSGSTIATSSTGTTIGPILIPGSYTYVLNCNGTGGPSGPTSVTVVVNAVTPVATVTSFTATPNNIPSGGTIVLSWTSNNATSCTGGGGSGSDGWNGSTQATSSSGITIGPLSTPATLTYALLCTGPGGVSSASNITVTVGQSTTPASITSFSASPNSVQTSGSTALAWTTTNATSCVASGGTGTDGWSGQVNTSSSGQSVGPIVATGSVTYTLTCAGPGGSSGPTSASVTVGAATPPAAVGTFSASPNSIQAGQSTTLSWSTTNATGCTASGGTGSDGWNGAEPASSNGVTVGPLVLAGTYTYTLTCTGTGGSSGPSSATVTVTPAPPGAPVVTISANNAATAQIQPNSSFTLKWSVTNATTCTATGGTGTDNWHGSQSTSSTGVAIGPITVPGIYTYNLSCTGSGGTGAGSVTVTVISSSSADCGIGVPSTALQTPAATVTSTTGGGLCVLGCGVANAGNVINSSLTDFAAMTLALGVATTDTLTVTGTTTFPAGRRAGFLLANPSGLLSLSLLSNVTIQTLKSNVVQETATTSGLLGISALGLLNNANEGYTAFTTTKSFDSVRVTLNPLAGLIAETDVYGACVSLQ